MEPSSRESLVYNKDNEPVEEFLRRVEARRKVHLQLGLADDAKRFFANVIASNVKFLPDDIDLDIITQDDVFADAMRRAFGISPETALFRFENPKRKAGESHEQVWGDLNRMYRIAHTRPGTMEMDPPIESLVGAFMKTLPPNVQLETRRLKRARALTIDSRDDLIDLVREVEDDILTEKRLVHVAPVHYRPDETESIVVAPVRRRRGAQPSDSSQQSKKKQVKCFACQGPHPVRLCPKLQSFRTSSN